MITSQTIKNIEIIVVDSSEVENNEDLFYRFKVRHLKISPKTFNYANAFNTGAAIAKGKFLVRLSGDVIPKDKFWLEYLLSNFCDEKVAGVYSRWINNKQSSIFDRYITTMSMPNKKMIFTKAPNWNGASGALRKKLWQEYPFNEKLNFCEDWDWSRKIESKGYSIIYEPKSVVYHSHNENILQFFLRGLRIIRALIMIYLMNPKVIN